MTDKKIHMNCGGVGRYVGEHEVEAWKSRGYVVTEQIAEKPATTEAAATEKPLGKMNLAELDAKAAELGVVFPDDVKIKADRAAFLAEAIEAAAKAAEEQAQADAIDNDGKTDQTGE